MTLNMRFLRQFCRAFQHSAATTRLFFPDEKVNNLVEIIKRQ